MRCKRCRYYTQLMLLVGTMTVAMPLSAHQLGHETHSAVIGGNSVWHTATHAIESCVTQFSSGYLAVLITLLAVLVFVAFKVKHSDRVVPT